MVSDSVEAAVSHDSLSGILPAPKAFIYGPHQLDNGSRSGGMLMVILFTLFLGYLLLTPRLRSFRAKAVTRLVISGVEMKQSCTDLAILSTFSTDFLMASP